MRIFIDTLIGWLRSLFVGKSPALFATILIMHMAIPVRAQDDDVIPLHEREPFDRITLDKTDKFLQVEVFPIESVDRTRPISNVSGTIRVRRLSDPRDVQFNVSGTNITKLETFPLLLRDEANRLLDANQVDEAYYYIERLANDYPKVSGLAKLEEKFSYKDAGFLFSQKRYDEALLSLNQVFRLNPARPGLKKVLDRVLSQIINAEFSAKNYESVRSKLQFVSRKYGDTTAATVSNWNKRLKAQATTELSAARAALNNGKPTEALAAIRRANAAWKDMPEAERLRKAILASFPRFRVAVTQPFEPPSEFDPTRRELRWSTRRVSPLLANGVVSFKEFTSDGGVYESLIGNLKVSSDRSRIDLNLSPQYASSVGDLSRTMLQMANPNSDNFSPRWAEYLKSVYVPKANQLQVTLTRPSLLPESLLPRGQVGNGLPSNFSFGGKEPDGVQTFSLRGQKTGQSANAIREISETYYPDPSDATDALLAGEVDAIDRVYPADLANVRSQSEYELKQYRLPTIHAIVFNDREALLRNATFRRGMLYAINRQEFVRTEINAGVSPPVGRVISGFAPIGENFDDPLSYAYNRDVQPRPYDPSLAVVLLRLAMAQQKASQAPKSNEEAAEKTVQATNDANESEAKNDANKSEEEKVEFPELVLAHSDSPIATSACSAIAQDLRRVGLKVMLRKLEAGRGWPSDKDWDALYIETTIEEPLADLPNLILNHGILGRHGGLLWQATRSLQEAPDLAEARHQFERMHQLTHSHTPLIPLWQILEHAAIRKGVGGIPRQPISLYRNVQQWRLGQ